MPELDYVDPAEAAKRAPAIPRFFTKAVEMTFKSQEAGRPIYEDRDFVEILIPGQRNAMAHEPVNPEHMTRWPTQFAAFKAGKELPLDGTPLANWPNPRVTRSLVEELAYFNIRTVEDLAKVNDSHLQNLGMGAYELRKSAQMFLEVAEKGTAPLERLLAKNQSLEDQVTRLTAELTEANARAQRFETQLEALRDVRA